MAPLTDGQEKIAAIIPVFSGCLSIMGSAVIIFMERRKRKISSFRRIIGVMSCVDIVSSLWLAMSGFLLPTDGGRAWAFGNAATCTALGFFVQFGMATFLYNCSLNLYYCLSIIGGYSEGEIARYWEPWMHIVAIGYPIVTAILGLALGVYGEADSLICWVTTEDVALGFIFGLPFFFSMIFLFFSSIAIYWKFRQTSLKNAERSNLSDQARNRIRDVGVQATFYVVAAYSVTIPDTILRSFEVMGKTRDEESTFYWALVLAQCFYPLQGFLNCVAYLRPRYVRFRRNHELESRWWCFVNSILSLSVKEPAQLPSRAMSSKNEATNSSTGLTSVPVTETPESGPGSTLT